MEDQGPPGSGGCKRRQSLTPVLKLNCPSSGCSNVEKVAQDQRRRRSDSETLSDDPLLESNDEGIGTDHIDEKIDEGELKSAKELEVFMVSEGDSSKTFADLPIIPMVNTPRAAKCVSLEDSIERLLPPPIMNSKNSLQLPSIVVQCESPGCEKHLSPMSSRSESPLSDRTTGMGRFSPQFYGETQGYIAFHRLRRPLRLSQLRQSERDDVLAPQEVVQEAEKKTLRNCKTPSPTKSQPLTLYNHLDVPTKDCLYKVPPPRKLSPKRRIARSQVVSSSSSSDSITSTRENRLSSSTPSPDTIRWSSPVAWMSDKYLKSRSGSAEETYEEVPDVNSAILPKTDLSKYSFPGNQKISRLRAISHQIRFLRRLEQSLKRKERAVSPSDSLDSGEESPRATSPLLQPSKGPKVEIRKSSSIGKLQTNMNLNKRNIKYKRGDALPREKNLRVVATGNGYSD
ncbi:hypothetical protein NQ318_015520 [Aromia moschata]|uniref:Uncharacterized protein n=1 Tax=Aromia moschata TaxID=1265417 RepID=A0AAV8XQZ6_9CUCU|nr:hypothetical protein NQ318_015520 [Aromia moschata]